MRGGTPIHRQGRLSLRLREETRQAHRFVESLAFIRGFLRGVVRPAAYRRLLIDLHHVYTHLEAGLWARRSHPLVEPLCLPALFRQAALEQDLAYFAGAAKEALRPSPSALRYGERLRHLAAESPELLIAHAYTRYLGDLSGGQILRRVAARALCLSGDAGLAFYAFPDLGDLPAFKNAYRARLDALPLDDQTASRVVAEAIRAFACSGALFEELAHPASPAGELEDAPAPTEPVDVAAGPPPRTPGPRRVVWGLFGI